MAKSEEFLDQIREIDQQMADLELLREELYVRHDEEVEKEANI